MAVFGEKIIVTGVVKETNVALTVDINGSIQNMQNLRFPHECHAAVICNRKLYVISGLRTPKVEFRDLYFLNEVEFLAEKWKQITQLQDCWSDFAASSFESALYIAGGSFGKDIKQITDKIARYNDAKKWWDL